MNMDANKKTVKTPSLDGITLETIITRLSENMGWEAMGTACQCDVSLTIQA